MKNNSEDSLEELLKCFPIIEPPITVSGEIITNFSSNNPPIPSKLIAKYFSIWEEIDEYTEFIPCFRLDMQSQQYILVYWKGGLLTYEYILISLSKEGKLIAKKVIAGTRSNNQTIIESVALIDKDYRVFSVVGESSGEGPGSLAKNSTSYHFEIMPDGSIDSIIEEEKIVWEEEKMERKS